ncbi:hypothetical protein ACFVJM_27805 [Streptomyces virginiae]|uniref:hypothetical protein n=1 Tax=Streptomyces virginiae TaxID=1961 RepID=UPI00362F68B7
MEPAGAPDRRGAQQPQTNHGMDGRTGVFTTTVTENLLRAVSQGQAGPTGRPT